MDKPKGTHSLAQRLREAIAASGKTQAAICAEVGMAPTYLSRLVRGHLTNPSTRVLRSLEKATGYRLVELEEEGSRSEPIRSREDPTPYGAPAPPEQVLRILRAIKTATDRETIVVLADSAISILTHNKQTS